MMGVYLWRITTHASSSSGKQQKRHGRLPKLLRTRRFITYRSSTGALSNFEVPWQAPAGRFSKAHWRLWPHPSITDYDYEHEHDHEFFVRAWSFLRPSSFSPLLASNFFAMDVITFCRAL